MCVRFQFAVIDYVRISEPVLYHVAIINAKVKKLVLCHLVVTLNADFMIVVQLIYCLAGMTNVQINKVSPVVCLHVAILTAKKMMIVFDHPVGTGNV